MQLPIFALLVGGFFLQASVAQLQLDDIVDTAIKNGNFKTLVIALKAADLVDTLKGPGPFTVFAPTDAAFAKLPPGTLDNLLKPENKPLLIRILKYHVVAGNLTAQAIINLHPPVRVETLDNNRTFLVTQDGDKLKVNDATVIIADVFCTNGIVHAIDTVLIPRDEIEDIVDTAIHNGNFKTLVIALKAADLVDPLKGPGPFTVFAPTDAAFAKLPPGTLDNLLKPENKPLLIRILKYHVVAGNLTAQAIINLHPPVRVETLDNNRTFLVTQDGDKLKVNDATVIIADVFCTNGIIHAIDTVLIPREKNPIRRRLF